MLEHNNNEKTKSRTLQQQKRELSPVSQDRIERAKKIMSLSSAISSCSLATETDNSTSFSDVPDIANTPSVTKYSRSEFIKDWNSRDVTKFSDSWGLLDDHDGVFLAYLGDIPRIITRSIFIKEDMTVEVS